MEVKKIVIFSSGGLAREVADIYREINNKSKYQVLGFIDKDSSKKGEILNDLPNLGSVNDLGDIKNLYGIIGVGGISLKKKILDEINRKKIKLTSIIHPSVIKTPFVKIGKGCVICAGTIMTNNIKIGNNVFINLDVTVGHDVVIEDLCTISPGVHISGRTIIEKGCYIGTGAVIIPRVKIGKGSIVGAGAVVTKNVPSGVTVVGIPAKILGEN